MTDKYFVLLGALSVFVGDQRVEGLTPPKRMPWGSIFFAFAASDRDQGSEFGLVLELLCCSQHGRWELALLGRQNDARHRENRHVYEQNPLITFTD